MASKGISFNIEKATASIKGVRQISGVHEAGNFRYGIVVSRFNETLTTALVATAIACLKAHGAEESQIVVAWVPGAFEIPVVANKMAHSGQFDSIIALGVVLEGETLHARLISGTLVRAIAESSLATDIPIIDGVVNAANIKLAEKRCLSGEESRGWYCALAAMEMAHVTSEVR
jgi:6,7-dimethyl-8-ribityllumazine synthase